MGEALYSCLLRALGKETSGNTGPQSRGRRSLRASISPWGSPACTLAREATG